MIRLRQTRRQGFPRFIVLFTVLLTSVLAGCAQDDRPAKAAYLANPASVYCKEQGGKLEIRHEKDGEVGYCHLAYGRVVEEWVLYRATHHQAPHSPGGRQGA
nr:DUF333 domain-containing protein [Asaia bogorensis]